MANTRLPRPPLRPDLPAETPMEVVTYLENMDSWASDLFSTLQGIVNQFDIQRQRMADPARLPLATAADLAPGLVYRPGDYPRMVYCPDETDGKCLAVSDGADWLKITLGGPVST